VDEMVAHYAVWRDSACAAKDAYTHWSDAPRDEQADLFTAYVAALDQEESAASTYALLVAEVERWLLRG
jgi:hypothetical protein